MASNVDPDGPLNVLQFGRPRDGATMALIRSKLSGHATSARWLPEGLWPELDRVREEHLRVRARVADDLKKLGAISAKYADEDRKLMLSLQEGHRTGQTPKVDVTPEERRADERREVEASLWAGCRVLAEAMDSVRAVLAKHEAEWLADLSRTAADAEEAVREHERLLHEAQVNAWRGVKLGHWLKNEVNGGAFGHQPAPTGQETMPPQFDPAAHKGAFERKYYEQERVQPLPPIPDDDPLDLDVEDGDGNLSRLGNDDEGGIQPLDDEIRFGAVR